jgi:hypothetical protein
MFKIVCFALIADAILIVRVGTLTTAQFAPEPELSIEEREHNARTSNYCGVLFECA